MDVLVTMHYMFQQSSPIQWKVPQIPFIDRVLDSAVLGLVVYIPVGVQTTGLWSDSGENCGSAVAFF